MPRPRAAECPPVRQGRVRATDAEACGCKHDAPGVWQIFAGHQTGDLGATPAARRGVPGALGVLRDALSLGPLRVRFEFESWAPEAAMAPRRRRGGSRGQQLACWRGIWPAVAVLDDSVDTSAHIDSTELRLRASAVRARGRAGRARVVALNPNCGTQQLRAQRDHVARYKKELQSSSPDIV